MILIKVDCLPSEIKRFTRDPSFIGDRDSYGSVINLLSMIDVHKPLIEIYSDKA